MAKKKTSSGNSEADLIKTYYQISGKPKKSGPKVFSIILIAVIGTALLAAGALAGYLFFFSGVTPGHILNNVSILNIDVSDMTKDEALETVQNAFAQEYCNETMVVTMFDSQIGVTSGQIGLSLDAAAAVEAAYNIGRVGSLANRKMEQAQAALGGIAPDAATYLIMDDQALLQELEKLCSQFPAEPVDGSWELTGERPDLTTEELPEGTQLLTVQMGSSGYAIDRQALLSQVKQAYAACDFTVEYSCPITEPEPVDLDEIYLEICAEPVEAVMDPETFEVSAHTYGFSFDLDRAKNLQKKTALGKSFSATLSPVAPTKTKGVLEALLFRDVLGEYTAYSSSDPANRDVNLRLSCQAINGTVLMPGEIFSYNPALGERTPEAGWKQADGYVGSETRKEYGGGICQASSCLYLSAMKADLEIVERVNHGFISSYMPYGMDATVSWGGPEFRFKNTTEYPLRIDARASGGAVTVQLIGTDTKDYYVKMIYEVLSTDPYETVYEEMDKDNEKGYKDGEVIVSGYTGYKIRTYRCKYSKATDELISSEVEATSTYDRRDKVICKIIEEEATEVPTQEPTTETTESIEPSTEESTEPPNIPSEDVTDPPYVDGTVTEDGA